MTRGPVHSYLGEESSLTRAIEKEVSKVQNELFKMKRTGIMNADLNEQFSILAAFAEKIHTLGIQEGMDRGANSATEWVRIYSRRIATNDATGNKRLPEMLVSESLLKQASTAHRNTDCHGPCGAVIYENGKAIAACGVTNCQTHNKSLA